MRNFFLRNSSKVSACSNSATLGLFFDSLISEQDWSHFPFNGQAVRALKMNQLLTRFNPNLIIETGSYVGTTTEFIARIAPVSIYSIEKNVEYFESTKILLQEKGLGQIVKLILGDSAVEVRKILDERQKDENRVIAYLDAHWENELPLREELMALMDSHAEFVAVIDDFKVPGDSGYGFDLFQGEPINEQIRVELRNLEVWVPSTPAYAETGARRGTGYVFNKGASRRIPKDFFVGLKKIEESN